MKTYNEFVNERKKNWTPPTTGEEAKDVWWSSHKEELISFVSKNADTVREMIQALSDEDVAKATMKGSDKQIAETLLQLMDLEDLEREIDLDTDFYIPPK